MRPGALLSALLLATPGAACAGSAPDPNPWFVSGREALARAPVEPGSGPRARNVILFVGDGMGITTVTAARILEGQQRGDPGEEHLLAFERLPHVCLTKTYNSNQQVPDSAGTMSAMLTGSKMRAGVMGVDDGLERGDAAGVAAHSLPTLFEQGEARGLATGLVTTARITHATPAAAFGHSPERNWEDDSQLPPRARAIDFPDLARQMVEWPHGDGLDVVLGGGRRHLMPAGASDPEYPEMRGVRLDGRNLIEEWSRKRPGSRYVWNHEGLARARKAGAERILGLFEPSHMHFEVDRAKDQSGEPSLGEMTGAAIEALERHPGGYLLLVEGGRIDHGHHVGNAWRALTETIAFSDAVAVALEHTDPAETLVVVTADHGHVLTLGGYATRGNPILGLVVGNDARGEAATKPARDGLGLPYTSLGYGNGPGYTGATAEAPEGPRHLTRTVTSRRGVTRGRPDLSGVDTQGPDYLQEAAVPLPAETHSGEDVPVYAGGPGAQLFYGVQEQSYVYHALVAALGWEREPDEEPSEEP